MVMAFHSASLAVWSSCRVLRQLAAHFVLRRAVERILSLAGAWRLQDGEILVRRKKERKGKKEEAKKKQKLERIFSFEILIRDIRVQAFFCQMLDPGISEEPGVQTSSGEMNRGLGL